MAATPFQTPQPDTSFVFDIYHDGTTARQAPSLPGGQCNFVDLAHGANGARCGCRRFWGRHNIATYPGNFNPEQAVWCMCSHHACFHDDAQGGRGQAAPAAIPTATAGQENERPRSNREPLSPVQDLTSFNMPSNLGMTLDLPGLNVNTTFGTFEPEVANPPQGEATAVAPESSMPDTLAWGTYLQSQPGHTTLPPIPSQCLMPSQPPSTTSSSQQMRYTRPFAGKGLETLSSVANSREPLHERGLSDGNPAQAATDGTLSSVDLVAVPSAATPKAQDTQEWSLGQQSTSAAGPSRESFQHLSDAVNSHEQRLDKLEVSSFSVVGHDDCHEKHDHTDLRVTDLESRVEEVERRLNDDNSTVASSHRLVRDDDSTISVVSVATDATTRAPDRSEMFSQIQALQAKLNFLQASSLPTYTNPWELEVVFLPFSLKGIWMKADEFATQRQSGLQNMDRDEWTQLPNTISRQTPDPQSPCLEWADHDGTDSGWMAPRACVPGRTIERRLKSRGLIKTISVKGSDARSVQLAVAAAFGTVLRAMPVRTGSAIRRSSQPSDMRVAKFLGLQQTWVPLRKIHKDSRLRFLTPAEMLTPTLWDVAFLTSSVIMKATGMHRLYVTQPEAYIQDMHSYESGWCWQRLRELSRVYPDSQRSASSQDVPEADAAEECWAWDDRIDELTTPNPSPLSLRQAAQQQPNRSHSSGSSQQYFTGAQSPALATSSPVAMRAQSPLIMKDRKGSRPPHVRTTSMPPALPGVPSPSAQGKRRVSSIALANIVTTSYDRRSSPFLGSTRPSPRVAVMTSPAMGAVSKRRTTRSPSLRPRTTPRWSMSRSPSLAPFGGPEDRVRGTTPFCYATPYSNAPLDYHPRQSNRMIPSTEYEDADMGYGSDTDPYDDTGMNDDDDDDFDIEVYEDGADELDELDDIDEDHGESQWHVQVAQPPPPPPQGPEDEPWPGIEDNMSDGENMDPLSSEAVDIDIDEEDLPSDISSQPSEYPSTQRAWHISEKDERPREGGDTGGGGFKIHEDGDVGLGAAVGQWS